MGIEWTTVRFFEKTREGEIAVVQTHQIAGWFSLFGYLGHAVAHGFNVFDMLLVSAAVLHVYVSIREQKLQKQKTFSERRNRRL